MVRVNFCLKSARSPRTPSSDVKLKTPKLPDHNVAEATPQDSSVVPETPKQPRGILKLNDVSQKKRRVAFTTSGEQTLSSEEEDEKHTKVFKFNFIPKVNCVFSIYHRHKISACFLADRMEEQVLNWIRHLAMKKRTRGTNHDRMFDFLQSHLAGIVSLCPQSLHFRKHNSNKSHEESQWFHKNRRR